MADMNVRYEANDSGSKHPSSVYYPVLYYTVKLDLSCSSCNFTGKKAWLQSADDT